MKKLLWISLVLFSLSSTAQPVKKSNLKDKAPTNKEIKELMKEAQKALNEMSPEDKKMMDSLGIKMPSFNAMPAVSDKQLADAYTLDGLHVVVPSKKTALIALIPKQVFSNTQLESFLKATNLSIATIIKPEAKKLAEKVFLQFKNDPYPGAMMAASANGLWLMGYQEPAVYLMGKATELLPNADNYNNYASYLTMMGAAHMAVPILQKINSVHKKNSTVYNNLAQAWLQLGDGDKAEKYLDSAIMIYANHPQANFTKCLIQESRGEMADAVVSLKHSIKHSATKKKLEKLEGMEKNKKLRKYYVPRVYYSTGFNLGRYTAMIPKEYAREVKPEIYRQWEEFRASIANEIAIVNVQIANAGAKVPEEAHSVTLNAINGRQVPFSPWYSKALKRASDYIMDKNNPVRITKYGEKEVGMIAQWARRKEAFEAELAENRQRIDSMLQAGDNIQHACKRELAIANEYLNKTNIANESYNSEMIRKWVTDAYADYNYLPDVAVTDALALKTVLEIKKEFLVHLSELKHEEYTVSCLPDTTEKRELQFKKLPDFDEVNCKILNVIYVPLVGRITMRCNTMSATLNPMMSPLKAEWTRNLNTGIVEDFSIGVEIKGVELEGAVKFDKNGKFLGGDISATTKVGMEVKEIDYSKDLGITVKASFDENGFSKGSVELGISGDLKFLPADLDAAAPVEISLKDKLGIGLEVDGEGTSDFYVKNEITGDIASNIEMDTDVEMTPGMIDKFGNITAPEVTDVTLPNIVSIDKDGNFGAPDEKGSAMPSVPSVSISADSRWSVQSGFSVTEGNLSGLRPK